MRIIANNTVINKTKKVMDNLLVCAKDLKLPISERNHYYSEYLKLSIEFLKQSKNK